MDGKLGMLIIVVTYIQNQNDNVVDLRYAIE